MRTGGGERRTAFFDCSKSGRRSIVLALERFDDFRRAILAASHAAVSMVVQLGLIFYKRVSGQGPNCGYTDIVNGWLSFDCLQRCGQCSTRAPARFRITLGICYHGPFAEVAMPQYVIEREIPGAGSLSDAELQEVARKSVDILKGMGPEI